ncbi:MAG: cytotoxic translational repressor of toxin-antitoxin stability system [Euryarchaeota archaeon]|nr:cytotoxic translational repressor of toxin-antitoxin stability system [Euryarchaeota archaeon]MDP6364258.1 type II toxin-antitoxin system RelE/ParE family toxin [Candidatus Poseidoniia archaeon]MDP6658960.1 type II toxin-antitoxin system RelE/ParE family toxin [Candidatus Poseidoniia archaeon]MDP6846568.1 type II toxin-antitoxin system RelE/ParE family toxin [Candidatus Poseidoniia archaeon]MDP7006712.1 type II toxin-antitoxin system RelE/ParE family toxin [Candidatus Poseidoniia archaeon]
MTFAIKFAAKARKQLARLDREVQQRIVRTLERVRVRPRHYARRLVGSPYYRFRTGDYRIIADIRERELLILVLLVGHRKQVYG